MSIAWQSVNEYQDIIYEHAEGIAKITINRPEVRNAFRPKTLFEMSDAFAHAHEDAGIGVIILTAGLGYITYLLAFAGRSRAEMGLLQSLGLSRKQTIGLLSLEHVVIRLRRFVVPTYLAHVLQRGGLNLFLGRRWIEIVKRPNVPTHRGRA